MRTGMTAQTFGLLVTLAGCLIPVVVSRGDLVDREHAAALNIRQVTVAASGNTTPTTAASPATSETPTSQAAPTSAAAAPTSTSQQQEPTTTTTTQQSPTTTQQQSSSQAPPTTTSKSSEAASTSQATPTSITSAVVTTNSGGQIITSIVVVADTSTPSGKSSPTAAGSNNSSPNSSSISSSTIIGLSVAGGVAVLCVIGFFVWKFTRKRMGDYDNNEEIKWPELNAHDTAVPLPTNRTGGAGFDTGAEAGRSSFGYAPSTAANSTAELQPDPYAIPPLPHLDPNQPYRDDPGAAYYDPYNGPVPQSFSPIGPGPGEVIPMTQLAGTGRRSPGPGAAYAGDFGSGRASPGPAVHPAYDYGGRASPGPRAAQQGRSVSPGPQAAYGNVYSPR